MISRWCSHVKIWEAQVCVSVMLLREEKLFNFPQGNSHLQWRGGCNRWGQKLNRTGVVMIKNLVRRQEDIPSSYVPRYIREHRIKLHHPIWKPSLGTFIDPDLWGTLATGNPASSQGSWKTWPRQQGQVCWEERVNPPEIPGTWIWVLSPSPHSETRSSGKFGLHCRVGVRVFLTLVFLL